MNGLKDVEYAYAVAYIKTLENKMLTRSDMESLISADGIAAAKRILAERGWTGKDTGEILKNELARAWEAAYEVLGEDTPIDVLIYENDFHNLKTVLKATVARADWSKMVLSPHTVEPSLIAECIKSGDWEQLPEFLRDTAKGAYELLTETMDGQLAEIYIDKAELIAVLERAKAEKDNFLIGWAELLVKLASLKTAWRCIKAGKSQEFLKNAIADSNLYVKLTSCESIDDVKAVISAEFSDADTETLASFEKWCDNKKLAYVKGAKAESFSFRPIMAFLIGKTFEIQAVRIILSCKENEIGQEIIRERLRDMYV
ncbi:MAG: V-type ATPase subunit [Clostridia bacterium]|nr:V-type ATPase subunit [Clostridia bacterium]